MATEVIVAIVAGLSAVMVALVGKLSFDMVKVKRSSAATHTLAKKTESSINHDPETITKRLADVKKTLAEFTTSLESHGELLGKIEVSQSAQGETLNRMKDLQSEQGRDIRGLRKDDGLMRGEVRDVRKDLSEHLTQAEESMAVVRRMAPIVDRLNPDK